LLGDISPWLRAPVSRLFDELKGTRGEQQLSRATPEHVAT
jgi:hypothetical protein